MATKPAQKGDAHVGARPRIPVDAMPLSITCDCQINLDETVSIPEDSSMEDVKIKVLEYYEKDEGGNSRCKLCGTVKMGRNHIQDMKRHIETHLDGLSFRCQLCGKTFRSRNAYFIHKTRVHKYD